MLRLITGRAGAGKTAQIMDEIRRAGRRWSRLEAIGWSGGVASTGMSGELRYIRGPSAVPAVPCAPARSPYPVQMISLLSIPA